MTYTQEEKCWIWLATLKGIGPKTGRALADEFGDAAAVREAALEDPEQLADLVTAATLEDIRRTNSPDYTDRLAAALDRRGIQAVTPAHAAYSPLLASLDDAPLLLYAIGDVSLMTAPDLVAVVGSRAATNYGRKAAYELSRDLAAEGVVIVSGLARGVDAYAHQGALAAGGKTIAVLGCGVDKVYPEENRELYDQIAAQGLLLSEVLPGTEPQKGYFPERNRIISGLSHGVLIVEGGEKSGSRITANLALDQGREVMAVPGNIDLPNAYTPNQLIREGCALITCARDVLDALGRREAEEEPKAPKPVPQRRPAAPKAAPQAAPAPAPKPAPAPVEEEEPIHVTPGKATPDETTILNLLAMGPASFDEICQALTFSPAKLGATLTIMTAKGMVNALPGKIYEVKRK